MLANTAAPAESEDFILKHVSCLRKVGMYHLYKSSCFFSISQRIRKRDIKIKYHLQNF